MEPCFPGDGWIPACWWGAVNEFLILPCLSEQLLLYLLNCLYLNPWVFSLSPFRFSPSSHQWGVSERLSCAWLPDGVKPEHSSHGDAGHVCITTCSLFYYLFSCFAHNFQNGFWKIWHLCSLPTLMGTLSCDDQTGKNPRVRPRHVFTIRLPAWRGCWETSQLQCAHVICQGKQLPSFLSCVNRSTITVKGKKLNRKGSHDQFLP